MELVIILCVLASFLATWAVARKWIRKAPEIGLLGFDMNKPGKPKVAEMGGICVVFGFVQGPKQWHKPIFTLFAVVPMMMIIILSAVGCEVVL